MRNAGLEEAQAGIKIAGRNINNLRYADATTLVAESEEELKSLLMKVKVESEKVGLKLKIQNTKIMASGPITSWEIVWETVETMSDFILGGSKITADGDCSHEIKRLLLLGRKVMTNLDSILKAEVLLCRQRSRLWFFQWSCMDVRVGLWRKLSAKELMLLNCGVGEDTWESLDCKEIHPVHPKGHQSCVFIERSDAETETPVLWPPREKSWLIVKDSDAGRDWGQEEKGMTEDEMAGWHHRLDGCEFEWTPGVVDGQGGLACCDSWGCKVGHDWANELKWALIFHIWVGGSDTWLFKKWISHFI